MNENRVETTIGLCVIALTKYIMKIYHVNQGDAYRKLITMELYNVLMDADSRLYLETNEYLIQCCKIECEQGKDAFYRFINID